MEIFNNQKDILYQTNLSTDRPETRLSVDVRNWRPGLYYWKLNDEQRIVGGGKFKIGK
ncbi:MAG: hypothetical protein HC880_19425 [Bacteroidia bacterium]|nr:hypothetical protein [Bacteroidia bacterium]